MPWKPEVKVDGQWSQNALVFATREEAEANARNLMGRWMLMEDCRAIEVTDQKPNYRWVDEALVEIKEEQV